MWLKNLVKKTLPLFFILLVPALANNAIYSNVNANPSISNTFSNSSLILSDILVINITKNTTVISWQTNNPSDGLIEYGKYNKNYTYQEYDSNAATNHSIRLSNLSPATTYYFVINSTDLAGNSNESQEFNVTTLSAFPSINIAVVYEKVVDDMQNEIGRNISDVMQMLNETKTEMVFRGWWREFPTPDSCEQLPFPSMKEVCMNGSRSYEYFKNATQEIKSKNPNIIIIGGVMAQGINKDFMNNMTGEISGTNIEYPETWNMALDPAKWGINSINKTFLQCNIAELQGWMGTNTDCGTYDPANATAYLADITNPEYLEILKTFIDKQMQAGADGIWIDGLQSNIQVLFEITQNQTHPAVTDSMAAVSSIVDWFHSKYPGKFIGSWAAKEISFFTPNLDFVTLSSFSRDEILNMTINDTSWNEKIAAASKFGNVPLNAFVDWGWSTYPMYYFSQNLTSEEQSQFLRMADDFFKKKGILFIYPVHGAFLGHDATKLAYDKYLYYDSLAPEFDTYGTIKELALTKSGTVPQITPTTITTASSSGGGGGGGGGGASGENFSNVLAKERVDNFIFKDKLSAYFFKVADPIVYVNITGNINAGEVTTTVEVLKNTSTLVENISAREMVYMNANIWVGTSGFATSKNIKEGTIVFKIRNSWMNDNKVRGSDVIMVKWNGSRWMQLETEQKSEDDTYTYFETKTVEFGNFAITGLEGESVPTEAPIEVMTVIPASTESNKKQTAGFEIGFAVILILAVYISERR